MPIQPLEGYILGTYIQSTVVLYRAEMLLLICKKLMLQLRWMFPAEHLILINSFSFQSISNISYVKSERYLYGLLMSHAYIQCPLLFCNFTHILGELSICHLSIFQTLLSGASQMKLLQSAVLGSSLPP